MFMRPVLILLGALILAAGVFWPWLGWVGLGHLPGDIRIQRPGFRFYFPLGSSIFVSVLLSLAIAVIGWFLRR